MNARAFDADQLAMIQARPDRIFYQSKHKTNIIFRYRMITFFLSNSTHTQRVTVGAKRISGHVFHRQYCQIVRCKSAVFSLN